MPSPNQITVAQLRRLIGTPSSPVVIDVRIDEDFAVNPRLIPSARRHSHVDIDELATALCNKRVVVVCHKGKKLSEGAAAVLRNFGVIAEVLVGGMVGWLSLIHI